jgi:hypothetical protein
MPTRSSCLLGLFAACLGSLLLPLPSAQAIPYFARKYGFNCTMCHANFPRLNDFGVRYRENGYQLPGLENRERTVLQTSAPFAARTTAGYDYDRFGNTPDAENLNQFRVTSFDVLSAGLLGRSIGYLLVWPPKIEESPGVAPQPGTVEMANVIFSRLAGGKASVRAGRMEPAYVAFSVKRRLSFSPYEVYDFTFPGGPAFFETMDGVEFAGRAVPGLHYAAGWLNGSGTNELDDPPEDLYLRLAKVFGPGEGQTAGQRIGAVGDFGRARPLLGGARQTFNRLGADASLNAAHWNIDLQALWGNDNAALWGTPSDVNWWGGFVEGNYSPSIRLVGFLRYGWVSTPREIDRDIQRWVIGARYYPAFGLAVHFEYSHRRQDRPTGPDETEDFATAALDFAF